MNKGYPRPQFRRNKWLNLNGKWDFKFDDSDLGIKNGYKDVFVPDYKINVPFSYETKLSGINIKSIHKIMWYHREFEINDNSKNVILHFGAVDYQCTIYVNGIEALTHIGGNVSFKGDITKYCMTGKSNHLTLRVFDDLEDMDMPRGKQYWEEVPESIYYTRTSGIWQTVWIEQVDKYHLSRIKMIPDIDESKVDFTYYLSDYQNGLKLKTKIIFKQETIFEDEVNIDDLIIKKEIFLASKFKNIKETFWSPESPNLFDVELSIMKDNRTLDLVSSYFGMRKISIADGVLKLNNENYYMRLVLDQGYYPDSLLTSPNDEYLVKDILLTKEMGFNGVRKHQKIEEEQYLYYADKYGLIVWEELPSAYAFNSISRKNLSLEWTEAINRDINHPCIVAWVPMNESWGVDNLENSKEQSDFLNEMYYLTKKLDSSRLVISNDGWEHSITDLFTIHDYESDCKKIKNRYSKLENVLSSKPGFKPLFNPGYKYQNQPILVTEFGGISFQQNGSNGWGYSHAKDSKDFEERLQNVVQPIVDSPLIQGFCYTQLTDVEQEINGLLTYDRKPKISIEHIKKIISRT